MKGDGRLETTIKLAYGSLAVAILVLGIKALAYWVTGSIALYSDALESVINVAASVGALVAVRYSAIPADANHPYGHHKAEYISAVAEGVLIVIAALAIFREAWLGLMNPKPMLAPFDGLLLNAVATVINGIWGFVLVTVGRRERSPALVADGRHLYSDVISSVGVLAGVILALATGWTVLDPILAALVALNILWWGWHLLADSVGGLMDAAAPPGELERIRTIIAQSADGAIEAHDVRTRHAGRITFIDFHLVVDRDMSVGRAHEICDRIEAALRHAIGPAVISIHVEPDDKAKHSGIVVI